jgi:hypothetical protein
MTTKEGTTVVVFDGRPRYHVFYLTVGHVHDATRQDSCTFLESTEVC